MTTARTTFRKIFILRNFAFCNFYQNLAFQSLEEGWAILQPLLVSRSIITMTQLLRKLSVRYIFRKTCISHFTNFPKILVFSPYIRIRQFYNSLSYHGITTMTQLFREPAVRAAESGIYLGKLVICEILHFTNFPRISVSNPYKRIGQFCNSLSYHGITAMTQLLRKPVVSTTESGIYSGKLVICEISHFAYFPKILVFSPYIRIGRFCKSLS